MLETFANYKFNICLCANNGQLKKNNKNKNKKYIIADFPESKMAVPYKC